MICREKEKYFPVSFWYKERFLQSKRCRAEIERPVKAHVSYGVKITTEVHKTPRQAVEIEG